MSLLSNNLELGAIEYSKGSLVEVYSVAADLVFICIIITFTMLLTGIACSIPMSLEAVLFMQRIGESRASIQQHYGHELHYDLDMKAFNTKSRPVQR